MQLYSSQPPRYECEYYNDVSNICQDRLSYEFMIDKENIYDKLNLIFEGRGML